MTSHSDFSLPNQIEPPLERVLVYWNNLKRADNKIPFSDDLDPSALADTAKDAILIEVFEDPSRFRFNIVGERVAQMYGHTINGKFSDEINLHAPFDALTAQCQLVVKRGAPNYYRHESERGQKGSSYARMALPLWGNGHVDTLLVAVAQLDQK
jgi:hypothetical protein